MDHDIGAIKNEFGSCLDVDDGSKICAGGKIVVPGDVVKDFYDKSTAEKNRALTINHNSDSMMKSISMMKMNGSNHAEAWGTTSFEDPEFWGSASPTTNDDMPWDEMMKSKIWHPFKYSEYPRLNEIMVF